MKTVLKLEAALSREALDVLFKVLIWRGQPQDDKTTIFSPDSMNSFTEFQMKYNLYINCIGTVLKEGKSVVR